jgi:hypothetical protein
MAQDIVLQHPNEYSHINMYIYIYVSVHGDS